MSVRVLPRGHEREAGGSDYVRVTTCHDPIDDTVTLATIERVVKKEAAQRVSRHNHVKKLVTNLPMATDEAIGLATSYARRKNIDFVYADN